MPSDVASLVVTGEPYPVIRLTGVLDQTTEDLMRRVRGRVGESIIVQVSDVFAKLTGQSPSHYRESLPAFAKTSRA